MLSQKYIKSKLDCIENKLEAIEKSTASSSTSTTTSNNILRNIDTNTNSSVSNKFEFALLVNPAAQSYSAFKEISFQVLSGNIDVVLTQDGGGVVGNLAFPLTGAHGNINGDTFICDTESNFSISFTGTGQVYVKIKKQ